MRGNTVKLTCRVTFPETFDFSEIQKDAFATDFAQVLDFSLNILDIVFFFLSKYVYLAE